MGAMAGIGFMFGPVIGGYTSRISLSTPFWLAAGVTFLNLLWGYFILPESLSSEHKVLNVKISQLNPFAQFHHLFSIKTLQRLFFVSILFFFAFNAMEGNASVFLKDVFHWNAKQIGILLFAAGFVSIMTQGFLVRKLIPLLGEQKVIIAGLILASIGIGSAALTTFYTNTILLYICIVVFIIGDGLYEPSNNSLISKTVDQNMQGRVQGANQGLQSLTRIFGPLFAAWIYTYGKELPFVSEAVFIFFALAVFLVSLSVIRKITD